MKKKKRGGWASPRLNSLKASYWAAFKLTFPFAETFVLFILMPCRRLSFVLFILMPCRRLIAGLGATTRVEETFEPLDSLSCELATLAFFAVFKVLIRDFFWMDIIGS
jgi:hypothetical protein